ncbi:MAG: enoyl-CoA hydratase/isomerase family protein [Spirochaetes bacterium]|nr:enoyl-CoA hydratase/isomerase family protein [Spirochaetota bacterium]
MSNSTAPHPLAMEFHNLSVEVKDHIGYLTLTKSEQNSFDAKFLAEIVAAHDALESDEEVWGVIWASASDTFFSSGLDANYMLSLDRSEKLDMFRQLFETTRHVFAFSKPELVLLPGHAFAAGSVLAMAADWRFMAEGKARVSFPEVMLGISMPEAMIAMLRTHVGEHQLSTLIGTGDSFKAEDCLRLGVANALFPREELLSQGEKFMRRLFQKPLGGFRAVKKNLRRNTLAFFDNDPSLADFERLMGFNFEEALRATVDGRRPKFQNP